MTDNIPALIAEARAFADNSNGLDWQGRIRELADALEAAEEGWDADVQRLAESYSQQIAAEAERDRYRDLARRSELQCQDAEKDCRVAEAERDRYRAALEEARGALDNFGAHTARVQSAKRIIARALNENGAE